MKKHVLTLFLSLVAAIVYGQRVTLDELLKFTTKEPEEINNVLDKKGWFYNGKKVHEGDDFIQFDEPLTSVEWILNVNDRNDNSNYTHCVTYQEVWEFKAGKSKYEKFELKDIFIQKKILFTTYTKADYNILKSAIEQKFKKVDEKLLEKVTVKSYDGLSCWIMLGYITENPIVYQIVFERKATL